MCRITFQKETVKQLQQELFCNDRYFQTRSARRLAGSTSCEQFTPGWIGNDHLKDRQGYVKRLADRPDLFG